MENGMRRWVNNNEMPSKMPRMIYIMGTARSGSTILEILLGKGKGVFGAGELAHLIADGFIKDADCSCDHPVSECIVRSSIKEEPPEILSRSCNAPSVRIKSATLFLNTHSYVMTRSGFEYVLRKHVQAAPSGMPSINSLARFAGQPARNPGESSRREFHNGCC